MILQEIPLIAGRAYQSCNVTLGGVAFTITLLWNEVGGYWSMTVAELNGDDLLTNIKLVPNHPLTGKFQKLGLVGDLYFLHSNGSTYRPTFDDVGNGTYGLYYYDPEETKTLPTPVAAEGYVYTIWDDGATGWDNGGTVWF